MRPFLWIAIALFTAGATTPSAAGSDPTVEEVEDAVAGGKGGADSWAELIRLYRHSDSGKGVAEWALRTALARHPGHPILLLRKAALRAPHAAYPVLEELGRVPGWEVRAGELAEILRLGLSLPDDGILGDAYYAGQEWWSRLLAENRVPRALEIVEEGLRRKPGDRVLLARRALTLALLGRDDEAMKDQEASGWLQVEGGHFAGIVDAWTHRGKPDLAFRSCGGAVPPKGRERMVYALLLSRRGEVDAAEKLLDRARAEDMLLLLGLFLENGRFDRAVALQDAVVDLVGTKVGSNFGRAIGPDWASLEPPMTRAIRWLRGRPVVEPTRLERDPRHLNWSVEADFPPEAREAMTLKRRLRDRRPPTDEYIEILARTDEIQKLRGQRSLPTLRQRMGEVLVEAGRTKEGLAALATEALGPMDPRNLPGDTRIETALEWGLAQSGPEAEALAEAEPMGFIAVRRTLATFHAVKEENRILHDALVPPLDREIGELVSRGRGILPAVIGAYPRRTMGGGGCRPYLLAVIGKVGGPREVPFLLSEMHFHEAWIGEAKEPPWNAVALTGASAIDRCLARVTGLAPEAPDRKSRKAAWTAWWWSHAPEILGAK